MISPLHDLLLSCQQLLRSWYLDLCFTDEEIEGKWFAQDHQDTKNYQE